MRSVQLVVIKREPPPRFAPAYIPRRGEKENLSRRWRRSNGSFARAEFRDGSIIERTYAEEDDDDPLGFSPMRCPRCVV